MGVMPSQSEKAQMFLSLHQPGRPLLMPNPWDLGSARLLVSLGYAALATTSGGFAATLGRPDGAVSRDEALAHAAAIAGSVAVPVSADLENGFAHLPDGVAETIRGALAAGLAGCSVEDFGQRAPDDIYEPDLARDRVAAAAEAAHRGPVHLVLTARRENHLRGRNDLSDTIARLQSYQEAGADVLYAPGLTEASDIAALIRGVDRPVNVLALPGVPPATELAALGVARISVGSAFANVVWDALVEAGRELLDHGTYRYFERAANGSRAARAAFDLEA